VRRALGLLIAALLLARPVAAQGPVTVRNSAGVEVGTTTNPFYIQAWDPLSVYELNGSQTTVLSAVTGNSSQTVAVTQGRLFLTVNCSGCAGGTTVSWFGSADQVNYFPLDARQVGISLPVSGITWANSTTTAGLTYWEMTSPGVNFKATVTNYSSGTITVTAMHQAVKGDNVWIANATATGPLQVTLGNTATNGNPLAVNITGATGALDVNLPSGAATAAKQPALGTAGSPSADVISVQGVASGTAIPISAASLPLPSTAATSTKQSDGSQKTQIVDGSGNVIGATTNALDVNIKSGNPTTMTVTQGTGTNLHIVCDSGCSSSAGFADNGAFTFGTTAVNPIAGVFDDVATNSATENSAAVARITASKALHVNFRNASGTEIGTSSNPIQVTLANTGANTNKLLVTPDANSAVNVAQMNGVTVTMGNGVSGTGVQRVTLASDSTGQVALAAGSATIGALTANQSVNVAQINGVTTLMGNGVTGTGSQRVTIASDNSAVAGFGVGATGSAPPANANYIAGIGGGATNGLLTAVPVCDSQAFLDMTTATTTELVALTASQTIHICHIRVTANGATTMTFKRGTGTNCGTGTTAIDNAIELTAQTGYVAGIGFGEVLNGGASANAVCVTNSAAVNLHIFVRYAKY
jgi:hypothetical protein